MRLRVFTAPRMTDAMARLRAELGPDAVILSTRRGPAGFEITAALESASDPSPVPPPCPAPVAGFDPGPEPLLIPPVPPPAPPQASTGPLARHNIPPALAARLRGTLAPALAAALRFAPLPDAAVRPLALIGPCGAGKTLTCAKLAARLVLEGRPPLVVTADAARAGAVEQLAAFTRLLGLTLAVAASPAQVNRALARRGEGQPVLLDTAGCDPFEPGAAEALLAVLRAGAAAPVLVLPAGLDPAEAAETARAFATLGAAWMVPTRLDAARRLGSVLAAAEAGPLALAEAGTGPGVADGLSPLSPEGLAARLVPAASARDAA